MPRLALIALSAASLAACATAPVEMGQVDAPRTPSEQWRAELETRPHEVRLAVHAQGLSSTQADALALFAEDWRDAGGGLITVQAPSGGPNGSAAFRTSEGARSFLIDQGVSPGLVRIVGYEAGAEPTAPLVIGFLRQTAIIPECGRNWTILSRSADNAVQPNFGCAVTANMAAQIANPADLAGPRGMTAPDAARRAIILDKYRKGETTATAKDTQAQGTLSEVVK